MSDETPEALLKSALEKIVYFEARSSQLTNDEATTRDELERAKRDLSAAAQREIELRRWVAEMEVRATRAHSEREEMARVVDALRRERAELVGKMLEASRIHGVDQGMEGFDLAQFIAQLRSEVLLQRDGTPVVAGAPAATVAETVTSVANELKSQGRLSVSANDIASLTGGVEFPGRSEETLFGFSVRELSAPDASARVRAAERLEALRHPAAAPALAAALHSEREPPVQVALLSALASLSKAEAVPVVQPLLSSTAPDVRIAALKALLKLDPSAAGPYLSGATKDPDKAVRRRASLLALGLSGKEALELGSQAIRDVDADVRALAALVLGASNAEVARPLLLDAMRDPELRVRRAASQSLSRLLGQDVTSLVGLEDAHRRREVRKLATVPSAPVSARVASAPRRVVLSSQIAAKLVIAESARAQRSEAVVPVGAYAPRSMHDAAVGAHAPRATQEAVVVGASVPSAMHNASVGAHAPRATREVVAVGVNAPRAMHDVAVGVNAPPAMQEVVAVAHTPRAMQGVVAVGACAPRATQVGAAPGAHASRAMQDVVGSALAPRATQDFVAVGSHAMHQSAADAPVPRDAGVPFVTPAVRESPVRLTTPVSRVQELVTTNAPAVAPVVDEPMLPSPVSAELTSAVLRELRAAIRGRPLHELSSGIGASLDETMRACGELLSAGQIVRRGHKYFVA